MKVALITANLGNFDPDNIIIEQSLNKDIEFKIFRFTDLNFPPREKAMTSRLQARIPKTFGYEMVPGFDYYIWLDASFSILSKQTINWFITMLQTNDIIFFKHPDRNTIREEGEFIKQKIKEGNVYLTSRYDGELIDGELQACLQNTYFDDLLLATCSFAYKNNKKVIKLLKEWWLHISRYHIVDQLAIPYLLKNSDCKYQIIPENIYKIPYLTYTRNKK